MDKLIEMDGKIHKINMNPIEIIKELTASVELLQKDYKNTRETIQRLKAEAYKDDEIKRLTAKITELEDGISYGYPVSKEEWGEIVKWQRSWFKRKRGSDTYTGAIDGAFIYQFRPTSLGIIAKVIAPDGEAFVFRDDLTGSAGVCDSSSETSETSEI